MRVLAMCGLWITIAASPLPSRAGKSFLSRAGRISAMPELSDTITTNHIEHFAPNVAKLKKLLPAFKNEDLTPRRPRNYQYGRVSGGAGQVSCGQHWVEPTVAQRRHRATHAGDRRFKESDVGQDGKTGQITGIVAELVTWTGWLASATHNSGR